MVFPEEAPAIFAPGDASLFDYAPIALWAEDLSGLKRIFDALRAQGIADLQAHLAADPDFVKECAQSIEILTVNRRALGMLGAASQAELVENLPKIIRDDALPSYTTELLQLWEKKTQFSTRSVNYALDDGRRIDISVHGLILPGHERDWARVLVAIEDVTAEEQARRQLAESEAYAHSLFGQSPVSLWVEDFSAVKCLLDDLRARGITDFQTFIDVHPEFIDRCIREIRVIDVNQKTLDLFAAPNKAALLNRLGDVFRDEMRDHFGRQLCELWQGHLRHEREVINYSLSGEMLNLILQFNIVPGHERDWSVVLVSLTDITARKKAERYLEYLGKHDVLTGLYNRAFYVEEIGRLDRKGPHPVGILVLDLNGIKLINDRLGHAAGDAVLRRAGEVLAQTVDEAACAARIGGDEFLILLPATDRAGAEAVAADLQRLTLLNNQFHSAAPPLSFSMGIATCLPGERMEAAIQRADEIMYEAKRDFYRLTPEADRRLVE